MFKYRIFITLALLAMFGANASAVELCLVQCKAGAQSGSAHHGAGEEFLVSVCPMDNGGHGGHMSESAHHMGGTCSPDESSLDPYLRVGTPKIAKLIKLDVPVAHLLPDLNSISLLADNPWLSDESPPRPPGQSVVISKQSFLC